MNQHTVSVIIGSCRQEVVYGVYAVEHKQAALAAAACQRHAELRHTEGYKAITAMRSCPARERTSASTSPSQ
jgi:hypothetical protein